MIEFINFLMHDCVKTYYLKNGVHTKAVHLFHHVKVPERQSRGPKEEHQDPEGLHTQESGAAGYQATIAVEDPDCQDAPSTAEPVHL